MNELHSLSLPFLSSMSSVPVQSAPLHFWLHELSRLGTEARKLEIQQTDARRQCRLAQIRVEHVQHALDQLSTLIEQVRTTEQERSPNTFVLHRIYDSQLREAQSLRDQVYENELSITRKLHDIRLGSEELQECLNASILTDRFVLTRLDLTANWLEFHTIYQLNASTLQQGLDRAGEHLKNHAKRYFKEHSDILDILGKLDPVTRSVVLQTMKVDSAKPWFQPMYSFLRTVRCQIGLHEIQTVLELNRDAIESWSEHKRTKHDGLWRWLCSLEEPDLDKLVMWYNLLPGNQVVRS